MFNTQLFSRRTDLSVLNQSPSKAFSCRQYFYWLLPLVFLFTIVDTQALQIRFKDRDILFFVDSVFTASAAMRTQTGQQGSASGNRQVFADGGDLYSAPLSLLIDVSASKGDLGFFGRVAYIYDPVILGKDCSNCYRPTEPMMADGIADSAQHLAGNKLRLLDLFVFNTWHFGEQPLNIRVGKQVISWGESNIIGGGISQMQNPVDLAKVTTPGTEIKETLMPQESVYAQFGLTDNVGIEAYYVWHWRESVFIPTGTFFSPFDLLGAGYNPDITPGVPFKGGAASDEPDGGQWGLSVSTYMDSWNGTDLSFYWVRSHAFTPFLTIDENYHVPDPVLGGLTIAGYEKVFSQDQDTYGLSVGGLIPGKLGISFQGELNYKPDFFDTRQCGSCATESSDVLTFLGSVAHSANYNFLGSDRVSLIFDIQTQKIMHLDRAGRSAFGSRISDFSWGYIAVATLDYQDVFANIKISPSIVWVHDVKGYEPGAAGGLSEDEQAISASVKFSYLSSASLKLTYSSWLGDNGANYDRDNLSMSFKYNF
ncbi:MAG: DUF1302 family protein [Gammaproteobacteria bacterium]|nr:DUF1302 family protein [Gammaproteobacteria bacterium]MBQ0840635.1 DUF1302 family protein [Gammaproteobacteria bacterium]